MSATVERARRGQFDGVLQIVRYNWTLYVVAVLVAALVIVLVDVVHPPAGLAGLLILGAVAAVFWLALSLAVSHYVYDRSDLYRWEWIRDRAAPSPRHVVNIHAGLDETSLALQEVYPPRRSRSSISTTRPKCPSPRLPGRGARRDPPSRRSRRTSGGCHSRPPRPIS